MEKERAVVGRTDSSLEKSQAIRVELNNLIKLKQQLSSLPSHQLLHSTDAFRIQKQWTKSQYPLDV